MKKYKLRNRDGRTCEVLTELEEDKLAEFINYDVDIVKSEEVK